MEKWVKRNKAIWIAGLFGFFLPWLLFIIIWLDCIINKQTDCGFGLGIIFGLTIFISLICTIFVIIIGILIKIFYTKFIKRVGKN